MRTITHVLLTACLAACAGSESSTTGALAGTDRLDTNETLQPNQSITAGSTELVYQGDNNLVLYQGGTPIWASSQGVGAAPGFFAMQGDCNAVVYGAAGYVWASGTDGRGGSCYARVIEGDWFICSGSTRVWTARGGGDCGGGGGTLTALDNERIRLFDRWIAHHAPGENRCAAWGGLSWSERQVFLTITHRLSLYVLARPPFIDDGHLVSAPPAYALGGTMLSHIPELYAIRGTYGGDGGDESRVFMSMDRDLYIATVVANFTQVDDSGYTGWSKSTLPSNVAGGVPFYDYIRNSHDYGGPHSPFDYSNESKGGRTDSPGSPTIQSQYWSPHFYYDANNNPVYDYTPYDGGRANSPIGRPGVEGVVDPFAIEIDQDWDLFHHSDPTNGDFSEQYIRNYGDFGPNWVPPCS
jgi:hypothetical protein